jgi:hypothetical protein
MASSIHTLSSTSRALPPLSAPSSSRQRHRIMTLSDLPRQRSNEESEIDDFAIRCIRETRLSIQRINKKLDEIQKVSTENSRMLEETLELSRKILRGELNPNEEYTLEEKVQLRQDKAMAEETTRMLKNLEDELNSSLISRIVNVLKRLISAIDIILKNRLRCVRNHQEKTAYKVAALVLVSLGLGLSIYRFGPSIIGYFR